MQIAQKLPPLLERNLFNFFIFACLLLLYAPVVIHWYDGWLNKSISLEHEYFSHGLIGLPYAIYVSWTKRKKWRRLENSAHPLGAIFLLAAVVLYVMGIPELVNLSLPLMLVGLCLWLKGMPGLKLLAAPLLLTVLATPNPIPYLIAPHTLPLQAFIAGVAGFILMQLGVNVTVDGIYLAVDGRLVEVAPYCAGLKMLFTSLYVGLILLHWTENLNNLRKTSFLLGGAVLISVSANIIRNTLLSWFHGARQDHLFEWLHEGWGGDLYSALMLGSIVLLLKLIDNTMGEDEPEHSAEQTDNL